LIESVTTNVAIFTSLFNSPTFSKLLHDELGVTKTKSGNSEAGF